MNFDGARADPEPPARFLVRCAVSDLRQHVTLAPGEQMAAGEIGQSLDLPVHRLAIDGHGLPHTSAILQARLGLPTTCAAFDIGLGCSGYVYGLAIARSLMAGHGGDVAVAPSAAGASFVVTLPAAREA